jgi:hypothetical protein
MKFKLSLVMAAPLSRPSMNSVPVMVPRSALVAVDHAKVPARLEDSSDRMGEFRLERPAQALVF